MSRSSSTSSIAADTTTPTLLYQIIDVFAALTKILAVVYFIAYCTIGLFRSSNPVKPKDQRSFILDLFGMFGLMVLRRLLSYLGVLSIVIFAVYTAYYYAF